MEEVKKNHDAFHANDMTLEQLRQYVGDSRLVSDDPNMGDLAYCCARKAESDESNPKNNYAVFRYTYAQIRRGCRYKQFNKKRNRKKTPAVWEAEQRLALVNSKALSLDLFLQYVEVYVAVRPILVDCYRSMDFRKWRFHTYIKRQRSEANMVNRFKRKFGTNVVLGMGDWSSHGKHHRGLAPRKSSGLRKVFKRHKVKVVLVDEWLTSKRCSSCQHRQPAILFATYSKYPKQMAALILKPKN